MPSLDLRYIAAPMVKQADGPFRLLVRKYGASLTYTQMLLPDRILNDQDYLEYHLRDLSITSDDGLERPVVIQLCGHDPQTIVKAGRKLQGHCDAIDLNLGCPQESARDGHFGAYLLGQKNWPLVEEIVSAMSSSFSVPVTAKLRLCQPSHATLDLSQRLEACGVSWVTLHARNVSARRRRQGSANLDEVKRLKGNLQVPVVSNGNVREFSDLLANTEYTGADGVMVGETLLGNPCLFAGTVPDPVKISLEYLELCKKFFETIEIATVQTHIRHFVGFQCSRRSWFPRFRAALGATKSLEEVENLLRIKVERWRGTRTKHLRSIVGGEDNEDSSDDEESDKQARPGSAGDFIDLSLLI